MSRRHTITAREKLQIISYAEIHGNRAAGREFSTSECNVRYWRKMKKELTCMPKTMKANRKRKAQFPKLEEDLLKFVTDRRKQGLAVSTTEIRLKALSLSRESAGQGEFKASKTWAFNFLARNKLSVRRRTHIAQKLPEDYEEKLLEFQRYIIKLRKTNYFALDQIGNADQTPLTFDLPSDTSVAPTGSKTVTVKTTGNEKNRFTVMLACMADGSKLPPYIIFKRKTMPKEAFPKGVIVRVHPKGWMDDDLMKDWLECVWGKRSGGLLRRKSMLVLDSFRCHKSEYIKEALRDKHNTSLVVIPGGMTSVVQPLDVSVNKPMKVRLRQLWSDWMAEGEHTFTKGGSMRKPTLPVICQWILQAWTELDRGIIVKAFKKCCISNALDGTEDDMLWEDMTTETDSVTDREPMPMDVDEFFHSDSESETDFEGFTAEDVW